MADLLSTISHADLEMVLPSRVIILGSGGFVASSLAIFLESRGVTVQVIGSASIDLSDPETAPKLAKTLRTGDTLVVTAALTPEKGRDLGTSIKNLRMIETVASAINIQSIGHLIYFSSDAVYGITDGLLTEQSPAAPADLYGLMHRSREIGLREATESGGIPYCIVRPSAIYGAKDTHNSYGPNRFVRSALQQGKIYIFGQGEEIRDHVYIDDVLALSYQIILRKSCGLLNIVSGRTISFGDLAAMVTGLVGGCSKVVYLPRTNPIAHRFFDSSTIKRNFPEHLPTELEVGLKKMIVELRHG